MESLEEISRQYEETKRELLHRAEAHKKNNGVAKASGGKKQYIEKTVLHNLHRVIISYCNLVKVKYIHSYNSAEVLEEISRQYEETKRELLHRAEAHKKNNGVAKASGGKKQYIEKTVLHNLHRVIISYCNLVKVHREGQHAHGTNKGKGGSKKGHKRRNIKDTCKNGWSDVVIHDELARKVAQTKAIQRGHIERVNRFIKTDKSIGTFGKYVERVFRLRRRSTFDGRVNHTETPPSDAHKPLRKRRIKIILEKDVHFDLFLGECMHFLQVLLHGKSQGSYVQANYVKGRPRSVKGLAKEDKNNWWSRMLSDGGRGKQLGVPTVHVNTLPGEKKRVSTHFAGIPHGRINAGVRNPARPGEKKHENNSNDNERERRKKNDPFKDPISRMHFPLQPMDMKMELWSSFLDGNHHLYNCITRQVDPNLLYIIDNDRMLLRTLFFFKMIHLFVTYIYVTMCRSEPLFSCVAVFLNIIRSFHGTFQLASNGATKWKHAYAFFCAFASVLRRDILPPATGVSGGGDTSEGSDVSGGDERSGRSNVSDGKMHNQCGGNSHLVHSFGGLCFGPGRASSPKSDARKGAAPAEGIKSQAHRKGKSKNEQIGTPSDGQYCYYATVKNEDEVDSVNLAIHVTNTSKDNIFFYKRYIEEHIHKVFLHVYKLSEPKKRICSKEKNKEEGISDPSVFKNYGKLFRNFFQEIVS
ncbi:hypothetical protein AK88_04846 [Plasmodium fragile]|uniref:Uncharacterized protein n=1 Tax=Plasmodium fragile TaxID=5857 RepID=A0A0D9QFC7_PLAFR|nr:uncharacterized protein AK88_04846 [Plasmodium fragile]KJP85537.1 hypothetical protein AK88_04846 [Plasmodium fragile]